MKSRSFLPKRIITPLFSLLVLSSLVIGASLTRAAQEPPPATPTPTAPPPGAPAAPAPAPPAPPPVNPATGQTGPLPSNPLVVVDVEKGGGNPTVYYDRFGNRKTEPTSSKNFDDYRRGPDDQTLRERVNDLPYFSYNFFESARQIIDARRAYLRRVYAGTPTRTSSALPGETREEMIDDARADTNLSSPDRLSVPDRLSSPDRLASSASEIEALLPEITPEELARLRAFSQASGQNLTDDEIKARYRETLIQQRRQQPSRDRNTDTRVPRLPMTAEEREEERERIRDLRLRGDRRDRPDPELDRAPVDAFREVADPLSLLYRNAITSVPANYQLAPGDTLTVRYGSATRAPRDLKIAVDSQGNIDVEGTRLTVRGLTTAQVERVLRQRLVRLYRNVEVTVTLDELRTIQVTVSGEAYAPGTYTVPSVATAYNLLQAAGGPTERGSMRRIEVRRRASLVGTLDVYDFVTGSSQAGDIALQPGDYIIIPPRVSTVTIHGEVRNPAIFELVEGETLRDALRFAGGVRPSGVDQRVQVNTLAPGAARVLKDVNLRNAADVTRTPIYDGDVVEVFSVRDTLANRVTVDGAVDQPGDYALTPGMRVSDLVERARGPISEAYLTRADLFRWNPDNTLTLVPIDLAQALARDPAADITLTRWDRLKIYAREEVAWTGQRDVTVRGAVQRPGVYYRSENMRVRDLLLMAGGPTPEAYREQLVLLHQRPDGKFAYEYLRITDVMNGAPSQNVLIEDNDVLAIYRVGEAQFTPERLVSIRGEVVAPGIYPRGEKMRLSDLLKLAGGFRPAAGGRVVVAHARKAEDSADAALATISISVDSQGRTAPGEDVVLEDGDVVTVQGTGGFKDRVEFVTIKGAVNRPGPIVLSSNKVRLSDILREAGGLRPEAYPEGTEFVRNPTLQASAGQRSLAKLISQLNDVLNQSSYQREQAKSDLERIKAAGSATQNGSPLAGLAGGGAPAPVNPAAASVAAQLSRRDLVSPPRVLSAEELEPNGSIAVNLTDAVRRPGSHEDILMVDGDTITIPERPSTVQVVGAVFNGRGVLYKPGERLDYYVARSGGYTPDAARDRIVVIQAGGGLIPANKVRDLKPGDVIVVPTRVLAEKLSSNRNSLDSFFRSLTNSAIVYKLATSLFGL